MILFLNEPSILPVALPARRKVSPGYRLMRREVDTKRPRKSADRLSRTVEETTEENGLAPDPTDPPKLTFSFSAVSATVVP